MLFGYSEKCDCWFCYEGWGRVCWASRVYEQGVAFQFHVGVVCVAVDHYVEPVCFGDGAHFSDSEEGAGVVLDAYFPVEDL